MGVKGLWRLLLPIGRRISIETLEGKILAIDASIWLTQFLKAMRDPESGSVRPAAHLIGFFRRICKLQFQGIKPVFVFDGATPEIKQRELRDRRKRREQFAKEGEDAMQRMAKRLLAQQLKKKGTVLSVTKERGRGGKLTIPKQDTKDSERNNDSNEGTATASTSYAPGFYDPQMETKSKLLEPKNKKVIEKVLSMNDQSKAVSNEDPEMIELLDENNDYLRPVPAQHQSDWDTVVIDSNKIDDSKEKNTKKSIKKERKMYTQKTIPNNRYDFDIEFVASLPSTDRKDWVEKAQRQQRLQSRREFMKVAYDPDGLSQCQLRNFLRSTKLNKDIKEMATLAVKNDGTGDTLASDRTKRIIFEKDAGMHSKMKRNEKKNDLILKYSSRRKLSVVASSDDESGDDIEWEEADAEVRASASIPDVRAIVDSDDESGSDQEGTEGPSLNSDSRKTVRFFSEEASSKTGSTRNKTSKVEKNDQSDGNVDTVYDAKLAQEMHDESLARALQDMESDTEEMSGGFFRTATSEQPRQLSTLVESLHEDEASKPTKELRDENLARILQSAEFSVEEDSGGGFLPSKIADDIPTIRVESELVVQKDKYSKDEGDAGFASRETNHKASGVDISGSSQHSNTLLSHGQNRESTEHLNSDQSEDEDDDDDVDWEDGDSCEEEDVEKQGKKVGNGAGVRVSQIDEKSETRPGGVSNFDGKDNLFVQLEEGESFVKDNDGVEEDWEGGERLDQEYYEAKNPGRKLERKGESPAVIKISGDYKTSGGIEFSSGKTEEDPTSSWDFGFEAKATSSNEMRAALEHAQATAANLTNWAGRAFRQAVAQHAEENGLSIPEAVKPEALQAGGERVEKGDVGRSVGDEVPTIRNSPIYKQANGADGAAGRTVGKVPAWSDTLSGDSILQSLEEYQEKWAEERKQQEREMDTVTDEMKAEAMQLLQLFGVPYIEAPAEAEAQCVMLEKLGLVDGIVTEDSDAFVFGGQEIYKNIFDDQKYVEVYHAKDAKEEMNLTHDGLVALALLLGGDYTEGVKGVGIVNGMEVIQAFDVSKNLKEGLTRFRKWLDGFDPADVIESSNGASESSKEHSFHKKHHSARTRWITPKNFPDPKVLTAYLNPVVDTSTERFSWGVPDLEHLLVFCNKHAGWAPDETRRLLEPVIAKVESVSMRQTRIDSFMRYEHGIKFADVRSKRLRQVLSDVQSKVRSDKKRKVAKN